MWPTTAIFLTWDDYGGFYDHEPPPQVDGFGFGIRVPMLVLSPYAKQGHISHELGEFSSVLRFIEDNWGSEAHEARPQATPAQRLRLRRNRAASPCHAYDAKVRSGPERLATAIAKTIARASANDARDVS